MVRGDPRCSYFCNACEEDCSCGSCGRCHNCRDQTTFDQYNRMIGAGCVNFSHDCKIAMKAENDRLEKEKAEEIRRIERKKQEIQNAEIYGPKLRKFAKQFGSDIVEIQVGKENIESRFVPKQALIDNSEYFKSLFDFEEKANGDSPLNSKALVLDTDVDRPDAFDCFIQFVYWGDYYTEADPDSDVKAGFHFLDMNLHANVYVLAERLQSSPLKTLAVRKASALAAEACEPPLGDPFFTSPAGLSCIPRVIETIYLNTPPGNHDAFRALISALAAHHVVSLKTLPEFEECIRMLPDFAVDLVSNVENGRKVEVDENGDLKRQGKYVNADEGKYCTRN